MDMTEVVATEIETVEHSQKGQGLVEYALIIFLVAVVVIATLSVLGPQINNTFIKITGAL